MSTSLPNINLNDCHLFKKQNYIVPESNDDLLDIYNGLDSKGEQLVANLNLQITRLNELIEKYPNHANAEGRFRGLLVNSINKCNSLIKEMTKKRLRAGWFARSGSGKSTILNRLFSDKILNQEDFGSEEKCLLPITTGGLATSSCAFTLTKKENIAIKDEITVEFLDAKKLEKKLIAAMQTVASLNGSPIGDDELKSINDCKNMHSKWVLNGFINKFKSNKTQYNYILEFIEKMLNGQIGERTNIELSNIKDAEKYAKHGNIACANVYQLYAKIIDKVNCPNILEFVDVPGSNAQKLDLVYFDFIEKSLDMMIFMFKEGGGNINDVDQENARDKYLKDHWLVNGIEKTKRFIFVYNKGRQIEANRRDLAQPNGSLKWPKDFLHGDLSRFFMFDGFDFSDDQNRFPFNNYKSKEELPGIDDYWSRIEPLNNNGGLYFLQDYLFTKWPLLIMEEFSKSAFYQIENIEQSISYAKQELDLLNGLNTPLLREELAKSSERLQSMKKIIATEFRALMETVTTMKGKAIERFNERSQETITKLIGTTKEKFLGFISNKCRDYCLTDLYPILLTDLIMRPMNFLCTGVNESCRWSTASQESKPITEWIRSKGPINQEGKQRYDAELTLVSGETRQVPFEHVKNAIESTFFAELERKTAFCELRDQGQNFLDPIKSDIDIDLPERRQELFNIAKQACVNLAGDLASTVQVYWFNCVNDILDKIEELRSNVENI